MHWYLIHTHIGQERSAFVHLEKQGCECYLPPATPACVGQDKVTTEVRFLFPRYLFLRSPTNAQPPSLAFTMSVPGVCSVVCLGKQPVTVNNALVEYLRYCLAHDRPTLNRSVLPDTDAETLADLTAVLQAQRCEDRVMALLSLASKGSVVSIPNRSVHKLFA